MTKEVVRSENVEVPSGVEVRVEGRRVSVKGPLGVLERDFSHAGVALRRETGQIVVEASWPDKRRAALVGTIAAHMRNMITGVTKGFTYKLRVIYAHFPVMVKAQKGRVVIENFGGERRPRVAKLCGDVEVDVKEDEIIVRGIDIRDVSQSAANIQQATKIKKKDPRVFLDGIYVYEKAEGM
ncbi:MAG: 50S ribosomal protein L6 [Candidatus Bathyarchaeia archaeon]